MSDKFEFRKDQIGSHLEYIGYDVEIKEDKVTARHSRYPHLFINIYDDGSSFNTIYPTNRYAKSNKPELVEVLNKSNCESFAAKFFTFNDPGILLISGWYPGEYEKLSFGKFVMRFNDDIHKAFTTNDYDKFLIIPEEERQDV